MKQQAYPAASAVAPTVHEHFASHLKRGRLRGETGLATLPDASMIAEMIDAAFWASLRREETFVTKISLAFLTPDETPHPIVLDEALPLDPAALARIGPAVERPGIHLGVGPTPTGLAVWGIVRAVPKYCCVVEVAEPGLIVVKHHRGEESAKYANVAVLHGDQVKIIDEEASSLPDCPELLTSLLGFDSPASWAGSVNVLVQLAVSMRAHRRGGLLLVVPAGTSVWRESVIQPIRYEVSQTFSELAVVNRTLAANMPMPPWQETVGPAVDGLAGLTAIDGAVLMSSDYELLAFGAKIARRKGAPQVMQLTITEPIEGGMAAMTTPAELGGTRPLAAAQFVHDQRDALALVASQDGRFTVVAWSPCENMVHAHRVETLLL